MELKLNILGTDKDNVFINVGHVNFTCILTDKPQIEDIFTVLEYKTSNFSSILPFYYLFFNEDNAWIISFSYDLLKEIINKKEFPIGLDNKTPWNDLAKFGINIQYYDTSLKKFVIEYETGPEEIYKFDFEELKFPEILVDFPSEDILRFLVYNIATKNKKVRDCIAYDFTSENLSAYLSIPYFLAANEYKMDIKQFGPKYISFDFQNFSSLIQNLNEHINYNNNIPTVDRLKKLCLLYNK